MRRRPAIIHRMRHDVVNHLVHDDSMCLAFRVARIILVCLFCNPAGFKHEPFSWRNGYTIFFFIRFALYTPYIILLSRHAAKLLVVIVCYLAQPPLPVAV